MAYYTLPKPLPKPEQLELFRRYRDGDLSVRGKLIESSMRIALYVSTKYDNITFLTRDDKFSLACEGLIAAVDTFDPDRGIQFISYATRCCHNHIKMEIRRQSRYERIEKIPINAHVVDGDGNSTELIEVIEDPAQLDSLTELEREDTHKDMQRAVNTLRPLERMVVCMANGIDCTRPYAQREIAEVTGYSQSYVSRMTLRLVQGMRKYVTE